MKREGARTRDPDAVRRALRERGLEIFNELGYFATNSNQIARDAGYAAGTFYTQFADKLELFLEVYRHWVEREWTDIEAAIARARRKDRAAAVVGALLRHHRAWAGFRRSLRSLALVEPRVRDARNAERKRQIVWLQTLAVEYGGMRPSNARALATILETERVLDAIADGDCSACGVRERDLIALTITSLGELLRPAQHAVEA